jgi:uncharacterized protein
LVNKKIGVISDTHGILRPEIANLFKNCDYIIHAGDIGDYSVIDELNKIAPVTAVRGNIDWKENHSLPYTNILKIEGISVYIIHQLSQLNVKNIKEKIDAIVFGHSHKPRIDNQNGVLYFNPGSAGPKRFNLPVSFGFLHIESSTIKASLVAM